MGERQHVTEADLERWFSYHPPAGPQQVHTYQRIREAGKEFARLIADLAPDNDDAATAVRAVREAVFWANASIACATLEEAQGRHADDEPDLVVDSWSNVPGREFNEAAHVHSSAGTCLKDRSGSCPAPRPPEGAMISLAYSGDPDVQTPRP